jgi:purine-binding chemotaxis protein CheW
MESARLLILSVGGGELGLIVDDVTEMITISLGDLKPPPRGVRLLGCEYLVGVCLLHEVPIMLLNIDALLSFHELAELGSFTPEEGAC